MVAKCFLVLAQEKQGFVVPIWYDGTIWTGKHSLRNTCDLSSLLGLYLHSVLGYWCHQGNTVAANRNERCLVVGLQPIQVLQTCKIQPHASHAVLQGPEVGLPAPDVVFYLDISAEVIYPCFKLFLFFLSKQMWPERVDILEKVCEDWTSDWLIQLMQGGLCPWELWKLWYARLFSCHLVSGFCIYQLLQVQKIVMKVFVGHCSLPMYLIFTSIEEIIIIHTVEG